MRRESLIVLGLVAVVVGSLAVAGCAPRTIGERARPVRDSSDAATPVAAFVGPLVDNAAVATGSVSGLGYWTTVERRIDGAQQQIRMNVALSNNSRVEGVPIVLQQPRLTLVDGRTIECTRSDLQDFIPNLGSRAVVRFKRGFSFSRVCIVPADATGFVLSVDIGEGHSITETFTLEPPIPGGPLPQGSIIRRGPYTVTLYQSRFLAPGQSSDRGRHPGRTPAPGHQLLDVSLGVSGANSWFGEEPYLMVDGRRIEPLGGLPGGHPVQFGREFEIPADAKTVVFVFQPKGLEGPVKLRLR